MIWQYLRSDPDTCNGRVRVVGTRITARRALEAIALYPDRAELRREFPELTDDILREVLQFAALHVEDDEAGWGQAA